jgi:two-component system, cell cycle sensor histidine kinase and response regulator CckA
MKTIVYDNEAMRLAALHSYEVLDTEPEPAFEDLVQLAAQICNTPMALINLIDTDRQWFKAKIGLDISQVPPDIGFCRVCIEQPEGFLIIPDTLANSQFATDPVVTSYPDVRFYAGVSLVAPGGQAIGTLCVIDRFPKQISIEQIQGLQALGRQVVRQLELRRNLTQLSHITQNYHQAHQERLDTEQKNREQAALLDVTTDAILVRDLENKIIFWNRSAQMLYGWKVEEALGKNVNQLLYVEPTRIHLEQILQDVLQSGSWQGELRKVDKSGKEIIVESRWTLVRDEKDQPKSILCVDTDITQKKQLETQFLRAQRMESIGTLASGIAHDLNNVLAPILMSVQLLKLKIADERSQQMLAIVEKNATRGAELVKQVLSFARGMAGDRTVLQVKHLLLEMQQIVQQTFPKSIQVYTQIAPNLAPISADATQLHQVLMNLCVNARDAMPEGGILSISAKNIVVDQNYAQMNLDAKVGDYIEIVIADTGIGIDSEIQDKIFEPFFTTKDIGKGTGLGLSTVIGIIKSHGGFISVASIVGNTQFKVYLPAVNVAAIPHMVDLNLPMGNGEVILVVDDEAAIRDVTKSSLENYNYKVISASDGIEAIAFYAQHKSKISVAIIDLLMPHMDGATTIRTLAKMNPQLKIIAVSGSEVNNQASAVTSSQVKAFLSKPYTAQELLQTINLISAEVKSP